MRGSCEKLVTDRQTATDTGRLTGRPTGIQKQTKTDRKTKVATTEPPTELSSKKSKPVWDSSISRNTHQSKPSLLHFNHFPKKKTFEFQCLVHLLHSSTSPFGTKIENSVIKYLIHSLTNLIPFSKLVWKIVIEICIQILDIHHKILLIDQGNKMIFVLNKQFQIWSIERVLGYG